ncbi:hypothetical protein [uncultured Cohaesibacter sp.]|uniref:hypothetical protein n=1 Tax=uncultured Cohaesibacter sp. TaxID=1002546 RepID=UPI002930F1D0|nr:hypothetical protein [uncultured Cohaesibacter sp.]
MNNYSLYGHSALELIEDQLDQHANGILKALAMLEPQAAVNSWLEIIRAIEELINLPSKLDDEVLERELVGLILTETNISPRLKFVLHHLRYLYGADFAQRQAKLLIQLSAMQKSFAMHGILQAAQGLATVGHAIGYLQSRRRHFVGLLYLMGSGACRGHITMTASDALTWILPQAEISGTTIVGLLQQRVLSKLYDDFTLHVGSKGFTASHSYPTLDELSLEAERVPIIERTSYLQSKRIENVPPRRVFSATELRNNIVLIEEAFAEFGLENTPFAAMAALVRELSYKAQDDFWVTVSPKFLDVLAERNGVSASNRLLLTFTNDDFISALNSYAPFVRAGCEIRSSVTLLGRFLYNYKNICLYRKRRFQIRSGFIFEDRIKNELVKQGFKILPVKRIKRKEFDVIATRDNVCFNVQCKNNLVDPSWVDLNPKRFIKTNRILERYYERAIIKESSREQLLRDHLGFERIEPFVVSRFPIVTNNARIIPLARIHDFSATVLDVLKTEPNDR